MTRQRRAILEELSKLDSHPSAHEVHEIVRRRLPRISLGTVYRNLEILCMNGMAQKLVMDDSRTRFDGNAGRHYHLSCERCGRVADAPIKPLTQIDQTLQELTDFEVLGHRLEFFGLCPECRKETKPFDQEHPLKSKKGSTDEP